MSLFRYFSVVCLGIVLTACQTPYYTSAQQAEVKPVKGLCKLEKLPAPTKKTAMAVYNFPDLTGAFKSNDGFAVYSKAVPQGADTIVIDALLRAGNGEWFNVMERKGLGALIQERKISEVNSKILSQKNNITQNDLISSLEQSLSDQKVGFKTRKSVGDVNTRSSNPLKINPETEFAMRDQALILQSQPPLPIEHSENSNNQLLQNADYIIEGGIVGYDSDEVTGGGGLRLLNIGGFGEVRKDVVTVNLRLVSVKTGTIVLNTTLSKGIYSQKLQGSSFGYVDVDKILETEIGYSKNEPVFEALNLTIQTAVLDMVQKGLQSGLWKYNPTVSQGDECAKLS